MIRFIKKNARFTTTLAMMFFTCMTSFTALAQGTLEMIRVNGPSLEGNLAGDDATRDVFVYLPPGYASSTDKRYPVVYFLHGYQATAQMYIDFLGLPGLADEAIASGAREMIVVMPDAFNRFGGSFYSSSPTIGDWEGFVAKDLVGYIDSHYRTVANREHRGLSGHSMGGYGTLRVGMKNPDVFSAIYSMSAGAVVNQVPSQEDVETLTADMSAYTVEPGRVTSSLPALSGAWASNPQDAPWYTDWPYKNGELQPLVAAKWQANSILVMVDQYVPALKSFSGIVLDVGDEDGLVDSNRQLDAALTKLGVPHDFEVYEGTHGNRVVARFRDEVLPFFSEHLEK